ncbi:MAG TPA: hypothetical protein VFR35_18835 [Actinoplanes sp.]|nr:hypothetical protein [Actinoplanes sp.]
MAAWAIVAVPLLIMFFALGMERVEARLGQVVVGENDVEEFLAQARPNEVRELFRFGIGRALELFRLRRRNPGRHAAQPAIEAGPRVPAGAGFPRNGFAVARAPMNGAMSGTMNGTANRAVNGPVNGAVNGVAVERALGSVDGAEVTTPLPVIPRRPDPVPSPRPHAF